MLPPRLAQLATNTLYKLKIELPIGTIITYVSVFSLSGDRKLSKFGSERQIDDTYNYLSESVKEAPVTYELVSVVWLQLSNTSYNSWCKCFCCIYFVCVLRSPPLLDVNHQVCQSILV